MRLLLTLLALLTGLTAAERAHATDLRPLHAQTGSCALVTLARQANAEHAVPMGLPAAFLPCDRALQRDPALGRFVETLPAAAPVHRADRTRE